MPTYVVLYRFTEQGLKNSKDTVRRAKETRANNEQRGFKVHQVLWTQGQYDIVAVVEAPDEAAMMAGALNVCGEGNVRSETLRAFSDTEMEAVLSRS
ncbi:MAG: GYD domain-containing protein [Dehalococcoidia bacterium]|nr:GYD domain-containing protein [Dehalococcoidia bacterium]